jgi:hypothetical protein
MSSIVLYTASVADTDVAEIAEVAEALYVIS